MADSDDEYDRKRRDKFRGERTESYPREGRRGGGEDRRRDEWMERDSWGSRNRPRTDYRDYRGGVRERYSPARAHDISPPMKRVRTEWDDRRATNYSHDSTTSGYGSYAGSWGHDNYNSQHSYGNSSNSQSRDMQNTETQPPMMSFKAFLQTQDDNITDEEAIKKYNEYKLEFKRQQLNEFFVTHKEEEWFKIKYHPEDSVKRKDEQMNALKNRVSVFLEFLDCGRLGKVSVDADQSEQLVRLLDAVVIRLEGGTEHDLRALEEPVRTRPAPAPAPAPDPAPTSTVDEAAAEPAAEEEAKPVEEKEAEVPETKDKCCCREEKEAEVPEAKDNCCCRKEKEAKVPKAKDNCCCREEKEAEVPETKDKTPEAEVEEPSAAAVNGSQAEEAQTTSTAGPDRGEDEEETPSPAPGRKRKREYEYESGSDSMDEPEPEPLPPGETNDVEEEEPPPPGLEGRDDESAVVEPGERTRDHSRSTSAAEEEGAGSTPHKAANDEDADSDAQAAKKDKPEEEAKDSAETEESMEIDETEPDGEPEREAEPEADDKDKGKSSPAAAADEANKPRPLHRTASIFLRNLAPTITKQEVEAMCKRYPGFLRVAIADPQSERRWFRRGWVTFERQVNIKEICWNLNNIRLRDCELGAIVNRDLSRRIRTVNGITSHRQVVRHDIKLSARIAHNLDSRCGLWVDTEAQDTKPAVEEKKEVKEQESIPSFGLLSKNPVLKNITDYLIEEASAEEEELLGHSTETEDGTGGEETATVDRDEALIKVLDKLLFYLRIVHSVDYYNHCEYPNEDEMPNRCGIMHARGIPPSSKVTPQEMSDYCRTFEQKIASFLQPTTKIMDDEFSKLGSKDPDVEVEKFIQANTQELAKDKWLCPLSGKKFKGPEFVRKHIFNKHGEKVDEVKKEVEYFNNYLRDPKRPQLTEHPGNRPARKDSTSEGREGFTQPAPYVPHYQYNYGSSRHSNYPSHSFGGGYGYGQGYGQGYGRPGRGAYNRGRGGGEYRPVIHYRDLDAPREPEEFI